MLDKQPGQVRLLALFRRQIEFLLQLDLQLK
jgi:hypothetical protein